MFICSVVNNSGVGGPAAAAAAAAAADMSIMEPELTARLDSLCLRMTESFLGQFICRNIRSNY